MGEIKKDYAKEHGVARGRYFRDEQWEICGCGFEAESIKEHTQEANRHTLEALAQLDTDTHVSYWCQGQDHCCCTDSDWWTCNCFCHKNDPEERHCNVRLMRWKAARLIATTRVNGRN